RLCNRVDPGRDAGRLDGDREPSGLAPAAPGAASDAQGWAARHAPCRGAAGGIRGVLPLGPTPLVTQTPVIPVLTIERAADAVPLAQALVAGGLHVIEVTLRTKAAI